MIIIFFLLNLEFWYGFEQRIFIKFYERVVYFYAVIANLRPFTKKKKNTKKRKRKMAKTNNYNSLLLTFICLYPQLKSNAQIFNFMPFYNKTKSNLNNIKRTFLKAYLNNIFAIYFMKYSLHFQQIRPYVLAKWYSLLLISINILRYINVYQIFYIII